MISTEKVNPKRRVSKKFDFEIKELVKLNSPDYKKTLNIGNKKYTHTSGLLMWGDGGGSAINLIWRYQPDGLTTIHLK